jgi:UDP-2,3-diacylglucosamine pyrophosphatase LpxH
MADKVKIIVSDLHLGAGSFDLDGGNVLEDFIVDETFARFLDEMKEESENQGTDFELIIDGDMLEFLQAPALDQFDPQRTYAPENYRSSLEEDSAKKVDLIVKGHPMFFAALREFIKPANPQRKVTIVKGNHDVELYWSAVKERIRRAVYATGAQRVELLTFKEVSLHREGIYVEHGNQYAEKFNRVDNFEKPLDPEREGQLALPAGSRFVIEFFNQVEREKWWVDSIKPMTALIWYALAIDFPFAVKTLVAFLKAAPTLIVGGLVAVGEEDLSVEAEQLVRELEDEAQLQALGQRYAEDETFRREFNARVSRLLEAADAPPEIARARAIDESSAFNLGKRIIGEVNSALHQAAEAKAKETGAKIVVFGHTHDPLCERLESGGLYLNTGTWTWWRDFAKAGPDDWKEFYAAPEKFMDEHYLTYARIDYDEFGRPHGRVLDYSGQLVIECPDVVRPRSWWEALVAWFIKAWEPLVRALRGER